MIIEQGLNLLHKVIINKQPITIIEQYNKIDNEKRTIQNIYTKHIPRTKTMNNFIIHKLTNIYNTLDPDTKGLEYILFKNQLKNDIQKLFPHRYIPGENTWSDSDLEDLTI